MTLYGALGVLFALSVLVAVLDKKISHGIFFSFCGSYVCDFDVFVISFINNVGRFHFLSKV